MTVERIREIQNTTGYPDNILIQQALLQVWNEVAQESNQVQAGVMQMLAEEEIRSGWKGWLHNTFITNNNYFARRIKLALSRRGLPENVRQILNNYYTELCEINKRYLDASKHSA